MGYSAKVILDSVSPSGHRLTTMEATFPRMVLAEFNTHRVFSRNSASSRAIPIEKMIQRVMDDPFTPEYWGANQKGMQAESELEWLAKANATVAWNRARDYAIQQARSLMKIGVHKQLTNRLLEPFMWQTVIVSATEWSNFFALRCHPDAQPEIHKIALMMRDAYHASTPQRLSCFDWHLPLTPDLDELMDNHSLEAIKKISAGRCARVSYLTHHGERDPQADIELCDRLIESGHFSPLEHVARPAVTDHWTGNFKGWEQFRKTIPMEADFSEKLAEAGRH